MLVVSVVFDDRSRSIDSEHDEIGDACAVAVPLAEQLSLANHRGSQPKSVEIRQGSDLVISIAILPGGLATREPLRGRSG